MNTGSFYYPMPDNEPVLDFAPGSTERESFEKSFERVKK